MRFLFSLLYVFCLSSLFLFRAADATNYTTPIKHVVVLMLENRSFDHVLGQLHKINPAIDGLKGTEKQSTNTSEPSAPVYPVHKGAKWVTPDPDHGYDANMMQLFGDPCKVIDPAPMSGFLENGLVRFNKNLTSALGAISSFDVDEIPVYTTLINEFALMQKYYCSAPTSTWPNRLYIHSSTSDGETSTSDYLRMILGFPQKTIYDLLDENGVSWNSFFNELPDQLLFQSGRSIENLGKLRPYFEFAGMVKEGKLPSFSWISPKYFDIPCIPADDQHPPHDFSLGEQRVKEVYELLRASPSWNETLFIVTYDENGGFFDHVPTPQKDIPNPDGKTAPNGFKFDRLGARVPTLLISPWIEKGTLIDEPSEEQIQAQGSQFDHTSIIATVRKLFNITTPLTHRDAWAATFDNLFKVRDTPRTDCPETLPLPSIPSNYHSTGGDELSDLQREVIQIAAGAAGVSHDDLLRGMNKWRTELDGASWVIKTVYQQILKRDIPKSLQAALQLGPGHALSQCAEVHQLMNEEKEQTPVTATL